MGDQRIECVACGRIFIWSAGEQRYFAEHGLQPPKRCPECRSHRRAGRQTGIEPVQIPEELRATANRLSGRERRASPPARGGLRVGKLVFLWAGITLALALIVTVALWLVGIDAVVAWLIAITGITFLTYGYDKGVAGSGGARVPEKALLALALVGGTLGAWAGMSVFRHKTAKESFQFRFTLLVMAQIVLVVAYFYFR